MQLIHRSAAVALAIATAVSVVALGAVGVSMKSAFAASIAQELNPQDSADNLKYQMGAFGVPVSGCVDEDKTLQFKSLVGRVDEERGEIIFTVPGTKKIIVAADHTDGNRSFTEIRSFLTENARFDKTDKKGRKTLPLNVALRCSYKMCVEKATWYAPSRPTECSIKVSF